MCCTVIVYRYSKVVGKHDSKVVQLPIPLCVTTIFAKTVDLNITATR